NQVTIEGSTALAFSENVTAVLEARGWQVLSVADGEDLDAIEAALRAAQADETRPSLIRVRTIIGHGSPGAGTSEVHGTPLGLAGRAATRQKLGWPDVDFHVPPSVRDYCAQAGQRGAANMAAWQQAVAALGTDAQGFLARLAGTLPAGWDSGLRSLALPAKPLATRAASGLAINALAPHLPALVGGSADLAPSNNTHMKGVDAARNLHFGVREHAMGALLNGLALHGGFRPFGGTFLVFSDYMRGAMRLSAMMGVPVVYVLTHDSLAVGEDGPTHQPVEHVLGLRSLPGMTVLRPADAVETLAAWQVALERARPTCLILSRQNLPPLPGSSAAGVARGGYVLAEADNAAPQLLLIATGSEVTLALQAKTQLEAAGVATRVVSLPSWELFAAQPVEYRESVLPAAVTARVSLEAGSTLGWERWVGAGGVALGVNEFGASGPGDQILEDRGITAAALVAAGKSLLGG
ncbi:MAG: transketolase, partial [Magnetococcus sp. WYHC-3]